MLGAGGLFFYMKNHHEMMVHTAPLEIDANGTQLAQLEEEASCPTVETAAIAPNLVEPAPEEPVGVAADFAPDFEGIRVNFNSPFIYETSPNANTAAAFGFIHNFSPQPDRLIGASSDLAERVELHTMEDDNEIMRMRQVDAIEIEAGKKVMLEPQGLHIMLIGLEKQLKDGDKVTLTLSFEESGDIDVEFPVIFRGVDGLDGKAPVDHSEHEEDPDHSKNTPEHNHAHGLTVPEHDHTEGADSEE
jgi:hypothetical protein